MTEREVKKPTVRPILRTRGDEGFPHHHYKDVCEVIVVMGIGQVERGMVIVFSAPDKTTIVVLIDIAWRAWKTNKILTQHGTRY
jgi:hypothetical protein